MAKTTYIATAPDGSEHRRTTDRTYTHAVLVEGPNGWKVAGFCGRRDLAEKKRAEYPGSVVAEAMPVDGRALGDDAENDEPSEVAEDNKATIGALVAELLTDPALGYGEIAAAVKARFPEAQTSARSVASTACVLRKKGVEIPSRRQRT
jgi:hypothetical protein